MIPSVDVDLGAFSQRVRDAREKGGLTYEELADRAGCSKTTIRNYEQCKNPPKLRTVIRVADALGVELEDLVPEYKGRTSSFERLKTEDWSNYTIKEIAKELDVVENTVWNEISILKLKYGITVNFKAVHGRRQQNHNGRWVKQGQCVSCGYRCNMSGRAACQYILITGKQRPTPIEPGVCPAYERASEPYGSEEGKIAS